MRRIALGFPIVRVALLAGIGGLLATHLAPRASAAEPSRSTALGRFFPKENLVAYAEFDGVDAHADAWKKTAAYRLLNETSTGAMLEDLFGQLAERGLSMNGADMKAVALHAAHAGFALGVVREPNDPRPFLFGLVVRGGAKGNVGAILNKMLEAGLRSKDEGKLADRPEGRKLRTTTSEGGPGPHWAWWAEGDDLAICLGPRPPAGADRMIAALTGKIPDATDHPVRAALAKAGGRFTPVGVAFVDKAVVPNLPPQLASLGLDKVMRLEYRWGFDDNALATFVRLVTPAPRSGMLELLDQKTFGPRDLPSLPAGLAGVTAFSIDPVMFYDRVAAGFAATDPQTRTAFESFETLVRETTGHRLREDMLPLFGSKMAFYIVPTRVNAPSNILSGLARGLVSNTRAVFLVEVKDPGAFAKVFDDVMGRLDATFKARANKGPDSPAIHIRPLKGVKHGYVVAVPPAVVPFPAGFRPTFVLAGSRLIVASTPEAATSALALEETPARLPASDPLAGPLGGLPDHLTFLNVSDERQSLLPEMIANLPNLVQLVGMGAAGPFLPPPLRFGGSRFRIDVDPDTIPTPDAIRPFLFPSIFTFAADDQGFQFSSREAFPAFNPVAVAPVAVSVLLPVFQSGRAAQRRAQSVNNLKQIGLALHNYHAVNDHFPSTIRDKDGKPLLSWRVAILPYIEQQNLYEEFKLDEPWDSAHNKPLLEKMPATLMIPGSAARPGLTFYRGFSGEKAMFDPKEKEGISIESVLDGTSNTIGVVEAREAVPWTKPDDEIAFDINAKPEAIKNLGKSLGGHFPGGFNALFLDGSVHFLKETIHPMVLKALITRNSGEVISADQF